MRGIWGHSIFKSCLAAAALTALALGSTTAGHADDAATVDNPTYAKDIAPIMNENCVACHRPGEIGPMSLLSYEDVRPWVKSIRKAVSFWMMSKVRPIVITQSWSRRINIAV